MTMNTLQLLLCISLLQSIPGLHSQPQTSDQICLEKARVNKIKFYAHDLFRGDDQNVFMLAQANISDRFPSRFGQLSVLDVLVTSEPQIESKELGRIQGIGVFSDLKEIALDMMLNMVFTQGEYKGSTLSIFGRNPLLDEVREVSIVGGTGAFTMARGYVAITNFAIDEAGIYHIYKYEAYVYNTNFEV